MSKTVIDIDVPHNFFPTKYSGQVNEKNEAHGRGTQVMDLNKGAALGFYGESVYEGDFLDGHYHGYGILEDNLGGLSAGHWEDGYFTGWGKKTSVNQTEEEGHFVQYKLDGIGRINKGPWKKYEAGKIVAGDPTKDEISEAEQELSKTNTELKLVGTSQHSQVRPSLPEPSSKSSSGGKKRKSKKRNSKNRRNTNKKN